ncbi:MAG TPA: glycosyltransferase family 2 protein [Thermoleophilaceae bacterium]|nr:glycosyltransferase family 2 protein [Thermoleophilaceae bacterium]
MSEPRTTVMMPAYEAGATIGRSVESVLAQTVPDLELIVVDNASPTPVREVLADVRDPRLEIVRLRRNLGVAGGRNAALRRARAPLVSQLDADDEWEPDYLENVLPCFDDPGVGLAYSNTHIVGHPTGHDDYIGDPSVHPMHDFPKIAEQNPIPCPTATIRAGAARAVGGYARWQWMVEDYHMYLKLARAGWRFAYVHRQLARYRWPSPASGMSARRREHELWELACFLSFALRHPLTPGPRRQVRTRVMRELRRLHFAG